MLFALPLFTLARSGDQLPKLNVLSPQNAVRIQEVARLGDGIIGQMVWSQDGRTLAVSSSIGVYLFSASQAFQVDTAVPPRLFAGVGGSIAISQDGRLLGAGRYHDAELWDVPAGKLLARMPVEKLVSTMGFNPASRLLAIGTQEEMCNCAVDVWDISRAAQAHVDKITSLETSGNAVCRILFSPDGEALLALNCTGRGNIWDTKSFWRVSTFIAGSATCGVSADLTPDGKYLAIQTCYTGYKLFRPFSLWNFDALRHNVKGRIHPLVRLDEITVQASPAFTGDYSLIAVYTGDESVHIYSLSSGREVARLRADKVQSLAFAKDDRQLYAVNQDGTVWAWDVAQALNAGMQAHPEVIAANQDEAARILPSDVRPIQMPNREALGLTGHQSPVESLIFAPDNRTLFTYGANDEALAWDTQTGSITHSLYDRGSKDRWAILSPDGRIFAGNEVDTVSLWDTTNRQPLQRFQTPNEMIVSSALSAANQLAVISGSDSYSGNKLRVWDIRTGRLLTDFSVNQGLSFEPQWLRSRPSYSADGALLAFMERDEAGDGVARVVDTATWRDVARIANHDSDLPLDVQFAPQGTSLAVLWPGRPSTLEIWDAGKTPPTRMRQFDIPDAEAIRFSPDGSLIAVKAGESKFVKLVDAQTGAVLASIPMNRLTSSAFSRDSRLLALGLSDGTVRLYGVKA